MALIPIPEIPDEYCSRIAVRGLTVLSETELHELLAALHTEEQGTHAWLIRTRGPDEDNNCDIFEESFGIDTPTGSRLERFLETFKQRKDGTTPTSYVHYRLNFERGYAEIEGDKPLGEPDLLSRFWEWAKARGGLDAWVTAGIDYPVEEFDPLLPLPIEVPSVVSSFDSVEGVSLIKWQSGSERRTILYEARMVLRQGHINVGVRFRRRVLTEDFSIDDVVTRSIEIGTFAVTRKTEST